MRKLLVSLLGAAALTGCGTSSEYRQMISEKPAPAGYTVESVKDKTAQAEGELLDLMKTYLTEILTEKNLVPADPANATRIKISIIDYRMRTAVMRFLFGFWAGQDRIKAIVTFTDASGAPVGDFIATAYNATATGGPEALARVLMREIRDQILKPTPSKPEAEKAKAAPPASYGGGVQ